MSSSRNRRRNLMALDPHCFWCGCEVIWYELKRHESMPSNYATLDHLFQLSEGKPRPQPGATVLACSKCNNERGASAEAERILRERLNAL